MVIDKVLLLASLKIKNKQGKILLLQRSRTSSYPDHWQLVEGKTEKSESPLETAKREAKEETGLVIQNLIFSNVYTAKIHVKGMRYYCIRVVFDTTVFTTKIKISSEHTSYGWFTKSEYTKLKLLPGVDNVLKCY